MPTWHAADQTVTTGVGVELTINVPSNVSAGDLLVAVVPLKGGVRPDTFTPPTTWLSHIECYGDNGNTSGRILLFTRIATDAEPASYTFNYQASASSVPWLCVCGRVTGALGAVPYRVLQHRHGPFPTSGGTVPTATSGFSGLGDHGYLNIWAAAASEANFANPPEWELVSLGFTMAGVYATTYVPTISAGSFAVAVGNSTGITVPGVESTYQSSSWIQAQFLFVDESARQSFCPPSAVDMGSSDITETDSGPGFSPPVRPPYESQKNITAVGYDPRTRLVTATSGGMGIFTEDPPTSVKFYHSLNCGRDFDQVADLDGIIEVYPGDNFPTEILEFSVPQAGIIPGRDPGQWLLFNLVGGYYFSNDDGFTWSGRRESAIGLTEFPFDADYYGINGLSGGYDTRHQGIWHNLETSTIGYQYQVSLAEDFSVFAQVGIRRGIIDNLGFATWEDSLPYGSVLGGGSGWEAGGFGAEANPIHGANGRWVAVVDYYAATRMPIEDRAPNLRINTSGTLDPASWRAPEWLISEAFCQDIYQGAGPTPGNDTRFRWRPSFGNNGSKVTFIPQVGHAAGGRWWIIGAENTLLYSDDNGDTWSNSLADHREDPGAMHPLLNWRNIYAPGPQVPTGASAGKVIDIIGDPLNSGRLLAIGSSYPRAGITNRYSQFCCSDDGGNTWGPVGQLPIARNLYATSNIGTSSTAMARYVFPCFRSTP